MAERRRLSILVSLRFSSPQTGLTPSSAPSARHPHHRHQPPAASPHSPTFPRLLSHPKQIPPESRIP
ncbi:hypothetical protein M440DRAFT_1398688 [Trichoderma longibrachiatum ATCC 18648]|uniref:Uncharacterized protein n=1 Tax=Trichoderma longibrachiatum ATCC 18648 TaxID=983965 RepID=A0A2T4CCW5_TRILO|nr:hypothetical protein M440DRAFT_1398688 [Trichoderma longibrachiatum ATCC 18648]